MPMKKVLLRSTLLTVCLLLLATIALIGSWFMATAPPAAVVIEIEAGANLSQIAHRLEERGVLRSAMALKLLARLRHQSNAIHTGRYRFDGSSDPIEILARLVSGDVEQASLTIPEGFTLQQIAERIGQQHLGDPKRFLVLSRDRSFLTSLGISAENLEGYLFPETYRFKPGIGEEALIRIMVQQLSSRLDDTTLKAAQKVKLNRHQLLTLASIIEKETAQVTEMPLISSVFHNRLERGI
ncbi:MAG: endolytic transglycosylase MltG, partial [Desulfuromonas sp.]